MSTLSLNREEEEKEFMEEDDDDSKLLLHELHNHPIHNLDNTSIPSFEDEFRDVDRRSTSATTTIMNNDNNDEFNNVMYETDEEKACEDVRRMAAAMAPQVQELEDVLRDMLPVEHNNTNHNTNHSSSTTTTTNYHHQHYHNTNFRYDNHHKDDNGVDYVDNDDEMDWDDDFNNELKQLATSEQMLRDELEFAQNFSALMGGGGGGGAYSPPRSTVDPPIPKRDPEPIQSKSSNSTSPPQGQQSQSPQLLPELTTKEDPPEQQTPTPVASSSSSSWTPFSSSKKTNSKKRHPTTTETPGGTLYSLQDHAEFLQLKTERLGGWYYCDMTKYLLGPSYNTNVAAYNSSAEFIISKQVEQYDITPTTPTHHTTASSSSTTAANPDKVLYDATTVGLIKEYCIPLPIRKLKRLYCGVVHHHVAGNPSHSTTATTTTTTPQRNSATLLPETPNTAVTSSSTSSSLPPLQTPITNKKSKNGKLNSQTPIPPISTTSPNVQTPPPSRQQQQQQLPQQEEPLPIRTVAIRIRPDVLCGAVMGAVSGALEALTATTCKKSLTTHVILKRQGGHLRGAVAMETTYPIIESGGNQSKGTKNNSTASTTTTTTTMAYVVDAQLCTLKCDSLERRLLVRMYHIQDDPEAHAELGQQMYLAQQQRRRQQEQEEKEKQQQQEHQQPSTTENNGTSFTSETDDALAMLMSNNNNDNDDEENDILSSLNRDENQPANHHLKQACSLIQRLMFSQQSSSKVSGGEKNGRDTNWVGFKDMAFSSRDAMQTAIGKHLESSFKPCPSVREENKKGTTMAIKRLTLPCLSSKDWLLLQECWTLCRQLFEELDNRDCTYNTLSTLRFGQFPCLTTLDVQYCSQLRRLSRESMISQLLSSAKELEDYAKSAEYNCANFISLLEPMVTYYGVPRLDLPTPKPLDEYPLDYTPPQISCPPWGGKVMEALNLVSAHTTTANQGGGTRSSSAMLGSPSLVDPDRESPFLDATQAVRMVYVAFMKQDDEEHGARLGRKNIQVMERLANMQSHQRAVLQSIRDAHLNSTLAARAADDFLAKAQRANNNGKPGHPRILHQQVPLLTFRFSVGASLSGTCCITATQIMFQTSYIPLVGGVTTTLLDLGQVTFQVHENVASSLLNMYPNTMTVLVGNEVVYSFRPSALGPNRLLNFLTVLKGYQEEGATGGWGTTGRTEFSQPNHIVEAEEEHVDIARLASTESGSADPLPI